VDWRFINYIYYCGERLIGRKLYWVEAVLGDYLTQSIYSCFPQNCSRRNMAQHITTWKVSHIVGIHVAIDCGSVFLCNIFILKSCSDFADI